MNDLDSPWKEALEDYLPAFLAFFFPEIHAAINWERNYESLDSELQQIVRDAELGRRLADKLFRVWRKDGEEAWVLVHVEVQNQPDSDFAKRMFVYHYRIFDRFHQPVVSLAVLGDDRPNWRPSGFGYELWGCCCQLSFPVVKLLDYGANLEKLEREQNPFALIVLAHLQTLATRQDFVTRRQCKSLVVKGLFDRGLNAKMIRKLFRLIDWMMLLPKELETQFREELRKFEEERKMPYITSIERLAMEEGHAKGLEQGREQGRSEGQAIGLARGLALAIELKFGRDALKSLPRLEGIRDLALLQGLQDAILAGATLEELRERIGAAANGAN